MKKNQIKIIIFLFLVSIFFYFLFLIGVEKKDNYLQVSFIDSGQADTILIKTPSQHNIVIDLGSKKGFLGLDKKIKWWNKNIDLLIITHPHNDHIEGIVPLLNNYNVKKIMHTGVVHSSPLWQKILDEIKKREIPVIAPSKNQIISLGENCFLEIIFPTESFVNKEVSNLNNTSIVSKLDCMNSKFLFMGDAESEVENELIKLNADIKSDVLKVGHHGSISSSQEDFLKKISPQIAIITVGDNNFGHPSRRVIRRLEKLNVSIFRTDIDGTINIVSDGRSVYKK
jgi:competence protein ComEC